MRLIKLTNQKSQNIDIGLGIDEEIPFAPFKNTVHPICATRSSPKTQKIKIGAGYKEAGESSR